MDIHNCFAVIITLALLQRIYPMGRQTIYSFAFYLFSSLAVLSDFFPMVDCGNSLWITKN